jgi:MinD-like ATPase involved in chromosome partitioning or flagellar assembly
VTVPVLTAVTDRWEASLVSRLERERGEVVVVRRCVDLADLLATAATGQALAAVVSADLRRLDGEALTFLESAGVAVVALVDPGDEPAERRLHQLGVGEVLPADAPAGDVAAAVGRAVAARALAADQSDRGAGRGSGSALADPRHALPATGVPQPVDPKPDERPPGRMLAVWGPTGAPGRTTVAVTLAAEFAAAGEETVLADADTYGGSVAQVLGLLDEAPGLAAAARAADHGTLDLAQLTRYAPTVSPHLHVLTGIVRPQRWPELRPPALARVFELARLMSAWVVVDCGFALEQDEELSYDTATPRRNGATLVSLEQADTVLAVGSAEPVGLQRLVRGLAELAELRPDIHPVVVVNRVRGSAVGGSAESRVRDALARYAGVEDPVLVPDDRPALDAALLAGRSLTESASGSPARRALADLAARLRPDARPDRRRRTRR